MHPSGRSSFLCVALLAAPLLVAAQEASRLPATGRYGLSFAVPEGGGAGIGLRRMISARTNAGLDITLDWARHDIDRPSQVPDEEPRSTYRVGVMPNLRLYRGEDRAVMPFIALAAGGEYADAGEGGWGATGLLEAGVGAEWFPADGVSLSASTGVRASYSHNLGPAGSSMDTATVSAFRSSLLLNLYF